MQPDVAATVFCHNEAAHIGACLASLAAAGAGLSLDVTVVVNGASDDSAALARDGLVAQGLHGRVYRIAFPDKSNAINCALFRLRAPARLNVFVDGYVRIDPRSLHALADALTRNPRASASTGVAGNGRTMADATRETLTVGGRLHGQLHAFRPDFVDRMQAAGARLPVGLYRGDGLLGSMVCHDLDAAGTPWDGLRIAGAEAAVYHIPRLSPLRPGDIRRQFRRKVRQMRGRLENAAIKWLIYREGYAALPDNADDLIAAWLSSGGNAPAALPDRPFMALALAEHRRAMGQRPTPDDLTPILFAEA